jgi:hypothetical protein
MSQVAAVEMLASYPGSGLTAAKHITDFFQVT